MRVLVVGAGGFSREVVDLVVAASHTVVAFFDEHAEERMHPVYEVPVVRDPSTLAFDAFALAIGDCALRERFFARFSAIAEAPVIVHPSASVSRWATIGAGTLVMQNAVVNAGAVVGDGCIVNVAACVAHDCRVGAFTHLAPAVQMAGGSSVGARVFCGTSSVLLPHVSVGDDAVCGAGAIVTKDVEAATLVVGVPARVAKTL